MVIKFCTHDELDTTLVWLWYWAPKVKGQGHRDRKCIGLGCTLFRCFFQCFEDAGWSDRKGIQPVKLTPAVPEVLLW